MSSCYVKVRGPGFNPYSGVTALSFFGKVYIVMLHVVDAAKLPYVNGMPCYASSGP